MTKQTFTIPEGCKSVTVEQVGNQIITTFEPGFNKERWRAKNGGIYYSVDMSSSRSVYYSEECSDKIDDRQYKNGNYFQTEEQAQRAADKLKRALNEFWEEELK